MTPADQFYFAVQDFQRKHPGTTSREAMRWLLVRNAIQEAIDRIDFSLDQVGFDWIWSQDDRARLKEQRELLKDALVNLPIIF